MTSHTKRQDFRNKHLCEAYTTPVEQGLQAMSQAQSNRRFGQEVRRRCYKTTAWSQFHIAERKCEP
jgi:hypothetical protein